MRTTNNFSADETIPALAVGPTIERHDMKSKEAAKTFRSIHEAKSGNVDLERCKKMQLISEAV